ncbi:chorismate mutase [bacterium]|nr:chorismate mutase [bacterium]MBU1615589.1 chorismate mutase [bacterium]
MKRYRQKEWWFEEKYGWDLDSVRDAIAWIDDQLIDLMVERTRLGWTVARIKRKKDLPIFNSAQEERVIFRWTAKAKEEGVSQESIKDVVDIVRALMEVSKTVQHEFLQNNHSKPAAKINPQKTEAVNYVTGNRS